MNLSRIWQGPKPAPSSINEYFARVVADGPDFFAKYTAAKLRFEILCLRGQNLANILGTGTSDVAALTMRLQRSFDPDDARALLAAYQTNALHQLLNTQLHAIRLALTDPAVLPARQFDAHNFDLQRELTRELLEPALQRIGEELERVAPIEEKRMREAAAQEAQDCGLEPDKAKSPQKSALVGHLAGFKFTLARCVAEMNGPKPEFNQHGAPYFWFAELMRVVEPLREHFNSPQPAEVAG